GAGHLRELRLEAGALGRAGRITADRFVERQWGGRDGERHGELRAGQTTIVSRGAAEGENPGRIRRRLCPDRVLSTGNRTGAVNGGEFHERQLSLRGHRSRRAGS